MTSFEQPTNTPTQKSAPLTFRLERQDMNAYYHSMAVRAAGKSLYNRVFCLFRNTLILGVVFVAVILLALKLLDSDLLSNFWFLTSLVLITALAMILISIAVQHKCFQPNDNGPILGRRSYEIEDSGLILMQDGIQQAYLWESIIEVLETPETIYLLIDNSLAHIFPKNVFPSPVQAQEFAAYARERVNLAHQSN